MRPPAMLEHEPPMLLGFSWSEITTLFLPTTAIWVTFALAVAWGADVLTEKIMLALVTYLVGETLTLVAAGYWYSKIKQAKPEGWHLHEIATWFHWLGIFRVVYHRGRWNI